MPPKRGGKAPEPAAQTENLPPPPDPNVLLYFQAAGKAFPHVDRLLNTQRAALEEQTAAARAAVATHRSASEKATRHYRDETRKVFEADIAALLEQQRTLRTDIAAAEEAFTEQQLSREIDFAGQLAELRMIEAGLRERDEEAKDWADQEASRMRELQGLRATIEARLQQYEAEKENLERAHEEDKRKLRDALVRKLRRVRDNMTAEPAGGGGGADDPAAGDPLSGDGTLDPSGAATARGNEELSREVSAKERDAAAQQVAIRQLEAEERDLSERLKTAQEANTQLLLRNASYTKTRRALEAKLADLKGQLDSVLGRRDAQERERLSALRGTVAMQANVINDLNSEIDVHIGELEGLRRRVRASRAARTATEGRSSAALRFLWAAAADARGAAIAAGSNTDATLASASPVAAIMAPSGGAEGSLTPRVPQPPPRGLGGSGSSTGGELVPAPPARPKYTMCEPLVVPRDASDSDDVTAPRLQRLTNRADIAAFLLSLFTAA